MQKGDKDVRYWFLSLASSTTSWSEPGVSCEATGPRAAASDHRQHAALAQQNMLLLTEK